MSGSTTAELEPLLQQLRRGRLVLCAGGELGRDGSLRRLIGKLLELVPETAEAKRLLQSRPLMAADFVRRRLGDRFGVELRRATESTEVGVVLRLLGGLPFSAVVTTSYDHAVERAFARQGAAPPVYTPFDEAQRASRPRGRAVYKLLGDPDREETVVWGAADLQRALAASGYQTVADELFRKHSFLLLGFEWTDAELGLLLERILSAAHTDRVEHFAVLPHLSPLEREELYAIYRIRVLSIEEAEPLAQALATAMSDPAMALPADDDAEGWLAIVADDATRTDAIAQLDRLTERLIASGAHQALLELYVGRAGAEPEASRRADWLEAAARVLEEALGDPGRALDARLAAYGERPTRAGLERLDALARGSGRLPSFADELARLTPELPVSARAATYVHLARVRRELGQLPEALTAIDQALTVEPTAREALQLRAEVLRQAERWKELSDALGRWLLVEDSITVKARLYAELGALFEERLGDPMQAVACFELAIETDPGAGEVRTALEQLVERRGDHARLVELLDQRVAHAPAAQRPQLRRRILAVCSEKLDNLDLAIAHCEKLLAEAPEDLAALEAAEQLYRRAGRSLDCIAVLDRLAALARRDDELRPLYTRLAAEWERQPEGARRAAEYLERLVAIEPRNEEALRALEGIYHDRRMWPALLETYSRHAAIAAPAARTQLWLEVGELCERELDDPGRALAAYLEVDRAEPDHPGALAALTRLYEATHAYVQAIEVLKRRATRATHARTRAELYHHAAELARDRLADASGAELLFASAIEADPTFLPPALELVESYRQRGEFLNAAKLLIASAPHGAHRVQRTRLLVEAGELYEAIDDRERATALYLQALEIDPEHVDAATRASGLLRAAGRWRELLPLAETLARLDAAPAIKIERLRAVVDASLGLGDDARARRAYEAILSQDGSHVDALRGMAAIFMRERQWAEAAALLVSVADARLAALPLDDRVDVAYQRGVCAMRLGQKDVARRQLEAARALDPNHRPSLLAVLDLGAGDAGALIATKKALLPTASREEQRRLWIEIGDLYIEEIQAPPDAIAAWTAGLEIRPDDLRLLHRVMRVHIEQKAWRPALDVLGRLIGNEKLPVVRAKYHCTAGMICIDYLGRSDDGIAHLWRSMEDDPSYERATGALERFLREDRRWKDLARFYQRSIQLAEGAGGPELQARRLRWWSALGELYLGELSDVAHAIVAFEVLARLEPENLDRHRRLAALYAAAGPPYLAPAATEHQLLLRADPTRIESYVALHALYRDLGEPDKAAACARAAWFLRPDGPPPVPTNRGPLKQVRRPLTEELWSRLRHPDEDPRLSALFALVAPVVAAAHAQRLRAPLPRRTLAPPNEPSRFVKALRLAAQALALAAPEIELARDQRDGIAWSVCIDGNRAVPLVRIGAPYLEPKRSDAELAFLAGHAAAQLRPERVIRWLLPLPEQLGHLIEAAIALSVGSRGGPAPTGELATTVMGLRRQLTPMALDQLAGLGHRLASEGKPAPIERARAWLVASERTAARAGLVLAGDPTTCVRALERVATPALEPTPRRFLDLVWSSATEDLFAVERHFWSGPAHDAQTAPETPAALHPPRPAPAQARDGAP